MSREAKILETPIWDTQTTVRYYECFGWELLTLNGKQIALTRETQDSVYPALVEKEEISAKILAQYLALRHPDIPDPQMPEPFSLKTCLVRFLLLIVPGVLYIVKKNKEKKAYAEALAATNARRCEAERVYEEKKHDLLDELTRNAAESRALFFGKRA